MNATGVSAVEHFLVPDHSADYIFIFFGFIGPIVARWGVRGAGGGGGGGRGNFLYMA